MTDNNYKVREQFNKNKCAMSDKKSLKEGRIRRFVDWVFYSVLNGINKSVINALKDDPEVERALEDFEEASDNLESALTDIGENPQKYIDDYKS